MAKVGNNPLLKKVTGKLGDVVVFRQSPNGPLMTNTPKKRTGPLSELQELQNARFLAAVSYGRRQMASPELKAMYQTGVDAKRNSPYMVAVADYLTVPTIRDVDVDSYSGAVGNPIRVFTHDDFRVASVLVSIRAADGSLLEQGDAVESADLGAWIYTATTANAALAGTKVTVSVKDIPGNKVEIPVTL